ncbi:MAG TPA: gliding motility-associated C-terminal domain-containing protein, partial [Cyclobacteriaceae bacterium]|nr:gliding motility-associated C-terminal domain-containing protein [Cyclobacteriaceae bacterium]
TTTIFKNSTPVFTQLVTPTDQVLCSADGKLVVNEVRVIDRNGNVKSSLTDFPITDFNFTYDRTTIGNTVLGPNSASTFMDNTNYANIGFDTYFVSSKRVTAGPGLGCSSAPYKVDILDKRIFPVAALTPFANTSCDPAFFEGEIQVNVTDASVNLPPPFPGAPFAYSYNWTVSATPSLAGPVAGTNNGDGSAADGDGDDPKGLKDGNYTLAVTNTQTTCTSTASTTIFRNSTPVFTQLVIATDQVLCKPDGKLVVNEVKVIDRNGTVQSNLNGDFPLSDFAFSYDRTTLGNTILGNGSPFQPAIQLDNTNYPAIGFDSYYVIATRKAGGPGLSCSSAPYKVDIQDKRLFPKVAFTSIANSACNVAKPNGSVTANASEQNGSTADPYTFAWTLNGGALAPTSVETDATPSSTITNALDGNYIATATNTNTGCPIGASFDLLLDPTRSTPNIIDVNTVDPIDCNPSASATVTKITIGSNTNSSLIPPNPNNEITGAGLAAFVYTWSSGTPGSVIAGQTAPSINNLVPGVYFVSVRDPSTDCQSGPKEADILTRNIIYPVVNISQTAKQISCISSLGSAALSASAAEQNGTTGTYNFTWYPSLDLTGTAIAGPSANNPNAISNLFVGNYSVEVQNTVTSCKASALFIVPDDAPGFMPVISGVAVPLTLCVGVDGDAQVRVIPNPNYPNPPYYNYKADLYFGATPNFSNPPDIANVPSVQGPIPGYALNFEETNLNLGFYTFLVTDNNTGCTANTTVQVLDGRKKPVVTITQDNPLINCDPAHPDGQLSATADNGKIQGYTFDWYAGSSVPNPAPAPIVSDNKLIGQPIGFYTVRVTSNLTHCPRDTTGQVTDGRLYPPVPIAVVVADRTSCVTPNGEVAASVGGVTAGYDFNWFDGASSTVNFTGPDYVGRDVGPYSVTATDLITSCESKPATVQVKDLTVPPVFDLSSTPSFCYGSGPDNNQRTSGTGSVTLTLNVQGMVLSDIQWTDVASNAAVGLGPQVFGLFPGTYSVVATSTLGCHTSGVVIVDTEIGPYNGISANNDGRNDYFHIDCIEQFPNNNVKIFNRTGILIYEANGYDNQTVTFRGIGEQGVYLA